MKKLIIIPLLFCCIILNAQIESAIESFNRVAVFGKINLRLEKAGYDSIHIQSSTYDIKKVKFEVTEGEINIKLLSEFPPENKVNITVYYNNSIANINAGGGAKVYNKGVIESEKLSVKAGSGSELDLLINVDSVKVKVSKGAFVRLSGDSKILHLGTATGGDFRSTNLNNKETYATLNGGTAEIKTAEYLKVKAVLGASLKYVEKPDKIDRKELLGGEVGKLEDF